MSRDHKITIVDEEIRFI